MPDNMTKEMHESLRATNIGGYLRYTVEYLSFFNRYTYTGNYLEISAIKCKPE